MRGKIISSNAATKRARHAPAADTAAVVTLTAIADERHIIKQIDVSYRGGVPTGAGITVAVGGTTVYAIDLPLAQETYQLFFPEGIFGDLNAEVVVTATDPGTATSCAAILNVFYQ